MRDTKIVVLGYNSVLASYLVDVARESPGLAVTTYAADVTKTVELVGYDRQVDVVVNCAAITDEVPHGYGARGSPLANRLAAVNSVGATNAALWARAHGAYLIHVSCATVMGTRGPYLDVDCPYPEDQLAQSKHLGELGVQAVTGTMPHTIVRFGWLYGLRYLNGWPVVAVKRKGVGMADNERGLPIHGVDAATAIMRLIHRWRAGEPPVGVVHVGNKREPVTWYEFLAPHFPYVEAATRTMGKRGLHDVYGLYPSSIDFSVGFGMEHFKAELKRYSVWAKSMQKQ